MSLVDLEKAFNRAPRKVLEWAMRRKKYKKYWLDSDESV